MQIIVKANHEREGRTVHLFPGVVYIAFVFREPSQMVHYSKISTWQQVVIYQITLARGMSLSLKCIHHAPPVTEWFLKCCLISIQSSLQQLIQDNNAVNSTPLTCSCVFFFPGEWLLDSWHLYAEVAFSPKERCKYVTFVLSPCLQIIDGVINGCKFFVFCFF